MTELLSQVMGFLEGANKYKSPKYPQESISLFFPACRLSLVLSILCRKVSLEDPGFFGEKLPEFRDFFHQVVSDFHCVLFSQASFNLLDPIFAFGVFDAAATFSARKIN